MFDTPVLFLVFNRPGLTKQVFEQIQFVKPKTLYVSADGPREGVKDDLSGCESVRNIIKNGINWPCNLKLLFHDKNIGCKTAVSLALDWFFEYEEEGIILEDDTLPDKSFFLFCQEMLATYKHEERIWSISGFNFGADKRFMHQELLFARMMNMWGWATWRRTYQNVDYSLKHWKKSSNRRLLTSLLLYPDIFDFNIDLNWINYWTQMFDKVAKETLDTWDFQWIYSQLLAKGLTVYPPVSLIQNIGFSEDATHTKNGNHQLAKIKRSSTGKWPAQKQRIRLTKGFEEDFLKQVWCDISIGKPSFLNIIILKLRQSLMRYRIRLR